jgi:hypothetical protein
VTVDFDNLPSAEPEPTAGHLEQDDDFFNRGRDWVSDRELLERGWTRPWIDRVLGMGLACGDEMWSRPVLC